ncbi:hypothetical protein A7Q09_04980 [Methylacidiphilum sp. Yel]|uniref:universal stress protein n=1 Tax=Methylacidiphilum sp. Yel TaxID=1847730 RepID=UPI00106D75E3|nr:universal stress protein [Methylacidiphilum sp. Yel]TFE69790.1 hypothetical protein A7Q09_04980 [Methylacidiphilum sp. Yel]
MYKSILLALENNERDLPIIAHVKELACFLKAKVFLLHVMSGFAFPFPGYESWTVVSNETVENSMAKEMAINKEKLLAVARLFQEKGIDTEIIIQYGDAASHIAEVSIEKKVDLIVMGSHCHGLVGSIFWGSTAIPVRKKAKAPILLIRSTSEES